MCKSITYTVEIIWMIKNIESYGFGTDKQLYNLKTKRKIKQSIKNGMIGYWLNKKFYSLKRLREMLYKPKKEYLPF